MLNPQIHVMRYHECTYQSISSSHIPDHLLSRYDYTDTRTWIWLNLPLYNLTDNVTFIPPDSFVSFPGGNATFTCHAIPLNLMDTVRWYVNGHPLNNLNLTNVESRSVSGIGSLEFTDIHIELNESRIRCEIVLTSSQIIRSQEAKLFLQGYSYTIKANNISDILVYLFFHSHFSLYFFPTFHFFASVHAWQLHKTTIMLLVAYNH